MALLRTSEALFVIINWIPFVLQPSTHDASRWREPEFRLLWNLWSANAMKNTVAIEEKSEILTGTFELR